MKGEWGNEMKNFYERFLKFTFISVSRNISLFVEKQIRH